MAGQAHDGERENIAGARLRGLVDALPDAVLVVSTSDVVVYANRGAHRLFGAQAPTLAGAHAELLLPGGIPPAASEGSPPVLATARRLDGVSIPVEVSVGSFEPSREHLKVVAVRDVTDQHQIEERYRILSEIGADVCFVYRMDGERVIPEWVDDDPFQRLTGYTVAEWEAREGWCALVHPDHHEHLRKQVALGPRDDFTTVAEYPIMRRDGATRWLRVTSRLLADDRLGVRVFGGALDVTAERNAELALAEHESHLREAQSVAHLGSWRWDIASRAVTWSDELYRIYGYEPGEIVPSFDAYLEHVHPDDRAANLAHIEATLERDEPYEHEYRVIPARGQMRWLYTSGAVVRDSEGQAVAMHGICLDVTDRHEAAQALADGVARLREAQEVAQLGSWNLDLASERLEWSETMYRLHGLDPAEPPLTMEQYLELVHPDDRDLILAAGEQLAREQGPYEFEYRIQCPDGPVRWLEARGRPVLDGEKLAGVRGTVLDITQRKTTELALAERETQLTEAQRVAGMGSFRRDVATDRILWSDEMYRVFGLEPGSVEPSFGWLLAQIHPEDRHAFRSAVEQGLENNATVEYEYRIVRPDGAVRRLLTRGQAERDRSGRLVAYSGVSQDVTERRREEELHRVVSEMVSDVLFSYSVVDGQMVLDWVTPAFERITGHTLPDPLPRELFRPYALPEDHDLIDDAERTVLAGRFYVGELRVRTSDGDLRWMRLYAQPVRDDASGAVVRVYGAAQDVTGTKRAEEALRRAYEQERAAAASLREADRIKDEFLSTASHELRTPLTAIVGFASALSRHDELDEATRAHLVERLEYNALALGAMVERLLDFSRLQAGAVRVDIAPVDLGSTVTGCARDHADEFAGREISLDVPNGVCVLADTGGLMHVLCNLVSNAHKYSPPGEPVVITAEVERGEAVISVTDRGPGLSPDVAERVFERFYRGPNQTATNQRGSGIGLAIAKSYVELMDGRIWVNSSPGRTTFSFTLPLAHRSAPSATAVSSGPSSR